MPRMQLFDGGNNFCLSNLLCRQTWIQRVSVFFAKVVKPNTTIFDKFWMTDQNQLLFVALARLHVETIWCQVKPWGLWWTRDWSVEGFDHWVVFACCSGQIKVLLATLTAEGCHATNCFCSCWVVGLNNVHIWSFGPWCRNRKQHVHFHPKNVHIWVCRQTQFRCQCRKVSKWKKDIDNWPVNPSDAFETLLLLSMLQQKAPIEFFARLVTMTFSCTNTKQEFFEWQWLKSMWQHMVDIQWLFQMTRCSLCNGGNCWMDNIADRDTCSFDETVPFTRHCKHVVVAVESHASRCPQAHTCSLWDNNNIPNTHLWRHGSALGFRSSCFMAHAGWHCDSNKTATECTLGSTNSQSLLCCLVNETTKTTCHEQFPSEIWQRSHLAWWPAFNFNKSFVLNLTTNTSKCNFWTSLLIKIMGTVWQRHSTALLTICLDVMSNSANFRKQAPSSVHVASSLWPPADGSSPKVIQKHHHIGARPGQSAKMTIHPSFGGALLMTETNAITDGNKTIGCFTWGSQRTKAIPHWHFSVHLSNVFKISHLLHNDHSAAPALSCHANVTIHFVIWPPVGSGFAASHATCERKSTAHARPFSPKPSWTNLAVLLHCAPHGKGSFCQLNLLKGKPCLGALANGNQHGHPQTKCTVNWIKIWGWFYVRQKSMSN